jgi:hypothetical protein
MLSVTNSIHLIQGTIGRLTEIGRHYAMEMNVKNTMTMRISMQPFPVHIVTDQK